jgi:hypothetical protein
MFSHLKDFTKENSVETSDTGWNVLLPFAESGLCETGFSTLVAIKTKRCSMSN